MRYTYFSYNTNLLNNLKLSLLFSSTEQIEQPIRNKLRRKLNIYFGDIKNYDIVEITTMVRELFECLNEYKLIITIRNRNYKEEVVYLYGKFDSFVFESKELENIISITEDCKGTSINYKKAGNFLNSFEDSKKIHDKLDIYFKKILDLKKLTKEENISFKILNKNKKIL